MTVKRILGEEKTPPSERVEHSDRASLDDQTERTSHACLACIGKGLAYIGKTLWNSRIVKHMVVATGVALAVFYFVTPPGWFTLGAGALAACVGGFVFLITMGIHSIASRCISRKLSYHWISKQENASERKRLQQVIHSFRANNDHFDPEPKVDDEAFSRRATVKISPEPKVDDEAFSRRATVKISPELFMRVIQGLSNNDRSTSLAVVIKAIQKINDIDPDSIIKEALKLIHSEMNSYSRAAIICAVARQKNADPRNALISYMSGFVTPNMDVESILNLVQSFLNESPQNREIFRFQVLNLGSLCATQTTRDSLSFLESTLFEGVTRGLLNDPLSLAVVIRAIRNVDPLHCNSIIRDALKLICPEMDSHSRAAIIQAVANIKNPHDRIIFIHQLQKLITRTMDAKFIVTVIRIFLNEAPENREMFVNLVSKFITPSMDDFARVQVIKKISRIPIGQRPFSVSAIQQHLVV